MEQGWIDLVVQRQRRGGGEADYEESFRLGPDETLAGVLARYDEVAAETDRRSCGASTTWARPCRCPKGVPWYPDDIDAWSVRWVLLHLIEEVARHAGHADIVREAVDGATMYPLMAAAEGWPATRLDAALGAGVLTPAGPAGPASQVRRVTASATIRPWLAPRRRRPRPSARPRPA